MRRWFFRRTASGTGAEAANSSASALRHWQCRADQLLEKKRYAEACALYERILAKVSDDLYVMYQLAGALEGAGELDRAVAICERALAVSPDQPGFLSRRAAIARRQNRYVTVLETYQRLRALHPEFELIDAMIGDAFALLGRGAEAIEAFDRALEKAPDNVDVQSDRLFILNYFGLLDRTQLFEEHRRWGASHESALSLQWRPHGQSRDAHRRLRIGYVSPDLRRHAVAFFIQGVLEHHDHANFEIFAIDVSPFAEDEVSRRLAANCDHWCRIGEKSNDEIAAYIREIGIDILVDLSGHTAHNRLLVFARRPAPIQVGWFGYMNTTGLSAIDYRFTDVSLDPPGTSQQFYTEKLFRLPSAACFQPDPGSPPVGPLPACANGYLTIASVNQWTKVTELTKDLWAGILREIPDAAFLVVARGGEDREVRSRIAAEFVGRGVSGQRLQILGFQPLRVFLAMLNGVDFALDPFPYGGGTTTLHCAWMGVPIVTLESESELGRSTPGILRALELGDLVAKDGGQYHEIAVGLAKDRPRLANYRVSLRDRFARSPLVDALPLTRSVEAAFRTMWTTYCSTGDEEHKRAARLREM
jgi:protein O-GlcNAc transferase